MDKLKFVFGIHCHQPVGNFPEVFEYAYKKSYLPFLEVMDGFNNFKWALHVTGPLWEFIEEAHPEYIDIVKRMLSEGRLEILGGGFYEPILAVIPKRDRSAQLDMMSKYIERKFGKSAPRSGKDAGGKPRGMWLAERVWEPSLASDIASAGLEYIIVDDFHFKSVGVAGDDLHSYYVTEDAGKPISVFPINETLRYAIPFHDVEESIACLKDIYNRLGPRVVVMADDGEKFGLWPGTHQLVYKKKWLEKFCAAVLENSDWLETATFSEVLDSVPPTGRVYLPTTSYFEMSEWSLPGPRARRFEHIIKELQKTNRIEEYKSFLKGGFWRNFLTKYEESNRMNKRMLAVSERVAEAFAGKREKDGEEARRELYRGQCNCAYWHGVFGGLYLPHLRDAIYRKLIRAESLADAEKYGDRDFVYVDRKDLDADGSDEVWTGTKTLGAFIKPNAGGSMTELDYRPSAFNIMNTLTRREEAYHLLPNANEAEENGGGSIHELVRKMTPAMKKALTYDWYPRASFLDHILGDETDMDSFSQCRYAEWGDFTNQPYRILRAEAKKNEAVVELEKEGGIFKPGEPGKALTIRKRFTFPADGPILAEYELFNPGKLGLWFQFAVEWNLSLLGGRDKEKRFAAPEGAPLPAGKLETGETSEVRLEDRRENLVFSLAFNRPAASLWRFPVNTVSQSESGFELTYQSSAIVAAWRIQLGAGKSERILMKLDMKPL